MKSVIYRMGHNVAIPNKAFVDFFILVFRAN